MATNAQDVFEKAMSLMDELSDSGAADTADTKEYKDRTLAILNILGGELYPYSDNYEVGEVGKRPIFTPITSFTGDPDDAEDDDRMCEIVLNDNLHGIATKLASGRKLKSAVRLAHMYMTLSEDKMADMEGLLSDMIMQGGMQ